MLECASRTRDFAKPLALILALMVSASVGCGKKQAPNENKATGRKLSREATDALKEIEGKWKVVQYKFAHLFSASDKEIAEMQGKIAEITQDKITFMGETCILTEVEVSTRDADDYFMEGYRMYPQELGIGAKDVKVFETNCVGKPFAGFFILNSTALVNSYNGIIYFLERQK